ncbi:hypothetical protein V6N13_001881 [Hibiscus sabdariffa]
MRRQKIFKKYERERDPQIAQDVLLVAALLSMDWTSGRLLLSGLLVFLPLRLVVVMVAAVVTGVASPSAGTEKCTSSVLPACSNGSTGGMGWVAAERLAGSVVVAAWLQSTAAGSAAGECGMVLPPQNGQVVGMMVELVPSPRVS